MSPLPERVTAARTAIAVPDWLKRPIDLDLKKFIIGDSHISEELATAVLDGELIETMEGAASLSLTINDPKRKLLHNGLLQDWVRMRTGQSKARDKHRHLHVVGGDWKDIYSELDGRKLAVAGCAKNGNQFDLTFENRAVNELRKYRSHKVWFRDQFTRAEAIQATLKEVKGFVIPFYCPELHKVEPIATVHAAPTTTQRTKTLSPGFAASARVTVKGALASPQQKSYIARVIATGTSMGAPYIVLVSSIMTITQESDVAILTDPATGIGLFSQIPADGWPATGTNIEADAHAFFAKAIQYYKQDPSLTPGQLAQKVQISAYPTAYDQWETEAKATLALYGIGSATASSGTTTTTATEFQRYAFTRGQNGKPEDSWAFDTRLAQEVNWRLFMLDNTMYYVEDEELIQQQPIDTISEKDEAIDSIDWSIDSGRTISEVTVLCRTNRWMTPPGAVVVIDDNSPADGPWLVHQTRYPLFSRQCEVTLQLPTPPKAEPAPQAKTVSTTTSGQSGGPVPAGSSAQVKIAAMQAMAQRLSGKPWVSGGGHSGWAIDSSYDCSGFVSAVLHAGGYLSAPQTTETLPYQPGILNGPGQWVTIYDRTLAGAGSVDNEHVIIDLDGQFWESGGSAAAGGGAGVKRFSPPSSYVQTFNRVLHPSGL